MGLKDCASHLLETLVRRGFPAGMRTAAKRTGIGKGAFAPLFSRSTSPIWHMGNAVFGRFIAG